MDQSDMEKHLLALGELVLKIRATQVYQDCQIDMLRKHYLVIAKHLGADGKGGLTPESAFQKGLMEKLHRELAKMADDDQMVAGAFLKLLKDAGIEPIPPEYGDELLG